MQTTTTTARPNTAGVPLSGIVPYGRHWDARREAEKHARRIARRNGGSR